MSKREPDGVDRFREVGFSENPYLTDAAKSQLEAQMQPKTAAEGLFSLNKGQMGPIQAGIAAANAAMASIEHDPVLGPPIQYGIEQARKPGSEQVRLHHRAVEVLRGKIPPTIAPGVPMRDALLASGMSEGEVSDIIMGLTETALGTPATNADRPDETKSAIIAVDEATALTPRHFEVLAIIANGGSYVDVSERLDINRTTARAHLGDIRAKLGAKTLAQCVALAMRSGQLP